MFAVVPSVRDGHHAWNVKYVSGSSKGVSGSCDVPHSVADNRPDLVKLSKLNIR